jgi:putative transposase
LKYSFGEAITSVFPQTIVQTCIVHLIRNSLAFVSWKDRKAILPAIKAIYRAENADTALIRLEEFEAEWGKRYPAIRAAWRRAWEYVVPFFAFAPGIRKMILHHQCRRGAAPIAVQDHQDPRQLSQ